MILRIFNKLLIFTAVIMTFIISGSFSVINSAQKNNPKDKKSDISELKEQTSVRIGEQVWMKKNTDVSVFRNGDPIEEITNNADWEKAGLEGKPAWCYYDNDPENGKKFGKLYNWHAVNDPRGLAPEGWRIPDDNDWKALTDFLGGENAAGNKMKSSDGWAADGNGTDESGFTALPGGYRYYYGNFNVKDYNCYMWSSDESGGKGRYVSLGSAFGNVNNLAGYKEYGFSVRCISE